MYGRFRKYPQKALMLDYCTFAYLFATSNTYTPPVTTTVEIDFDIGSGGGNVFAEIALAAELPISGGWASAYVMSFTDHFTEFEFVNNFWGAPMLAMPDRSVDPTNAFYNITFALTVANARARARAALFWIE
jgi:hypothetical protein